MIHRRYLLNPDEVRKPSYISELYLSFLYFWSPTRDRSSLRLKLHIEKLISLSLKKIQSTFAPKSTNPNQHYSLKTTARTHFIIISADASRATNFQQNQIFHRTYRQRQTYTGKVEVRSCNFNSRYQTAAGTASCFLGLRTIQRSCSLKEANCN